MRPLRLLAWVLLALGIGLSVAFGLIPASVWVSDIAPIFAIYFVGFLLIFPGLMAALLYRMGLRPSAVRYTA